MKRQRQRPPSRASIAFMVAVAAIAVACTSIAPAAAPSPTTVAAAGLPTVSVSSPANGAIVPLGASTPVIASATDTSGVSRIDLAVNGVVVDSYSTPGSVGQPTVAAELHWTPSAAGVHALTVIAYRPDGTASAPAFVAVSVSEAVPPSAGPTPELTPASQPTEDPPAPTEEPAAPTEEPTTTATEEPTPTATEEPTPTATASRTPRPTRRPTPTPTDPPDPPDIDLYPADGGTYDGQPDGLLVVSFRLVNGGTDRAPGFTVSATCYGYTQSQDTAPIPPGGEYVASFGFYDHLRGTEPVAQVVVDSLNSIHETNEDNNILGLPVRETEDCYDDR